MVEKIWLGNHNKKGKTKEDTMEVAALFEKVGFIYEYRKKMEAFYRPYFKTDDA